ncbi:MAG TPA: hypothetical protein VHX20_16000 [Terracidiphilus sp.]|nr:hypothetical protein [Terracidiphilus sp.]
MAFGLGNSGISCGWPGRWRTFVILNVVGLLGAFAAAAQDRVAVVVPAQAAPPERMAADELVAHLHLLYPAAQVVEGAAARGGFTVYLGTPQELPARYAAVKSGMQDPESLRVKAIDSRTAVIAGGSPRAVRFAVDALLQKLGFGFYLSYTTAPEPLRGPFSFAGWELADAPIARERVIFNWHNFLSGCSTWNLDQWEQWITAAARMRFNTVMVHAYGNNPMFAFSLNGQTKPTGYLTNTEFGRDWGTEHVLDVRRIVGGSGLFTGPVYGADASLVPDGERVSAAEGLMQKVFRFAADRGMGVTFALDVDTESANPQNVIATLPAEARFSTHGFWLANPDTAAGYAYYRAQVEQLMQLYPQITQLAVWFRGGLNSPWRALTPQEFPGAWSSEYDAALKANPRLRRDADAPSLFAIARIARAFRRALDETGHREVTLAAGSWRFNFLPAANAFMPADVALMPLDYAYEFPSDPVQESLRVIGRHRPVVPIIWAQHDDREFSGRSYTPFAGLGSLLRWSNSDGYGVIHWTTRPLDLFFSNVSDQVWQASENETLDATADAMAARTFGAKAREPGRRYLLDWIYDAPAFGRETSDRFLDRQIDAANEAVGARQRLALLDAMEPLAANAAARDWVGYYRDWERWVQLLFTAQDALQRSETDLKAGKEALARADIASVSPQQVIEQYARAIAHGHTSAGEKGILISLNLRWLPYFEAQRQAVGLDPMVVEIAPTHHAPLAQGAGRYTFDFDTAGRPIEVLGTEELGVPVTAAVVGSSCAGSIEIGDAPVTLSAGGLAGTPLAPGPYRMRLGMAAGSKARIGVRIEAGGTGDGAGKTMGSEDWFDIRPQDGRIRFTLVPAGGPAQVCGWTLERQSERRLGEQ